MLTPIRSAGNHRKEHSWRCRPLLGQEETEQLGGTPTHQRIEDHQASVTSTNSTNPDPTQHPHPFVGEGFRS